MPDDSPPVYHCEVEKLIPFENQKAAEAWLRENKLDISSTSLLVPFKNTIGRIEFLRLADDRDCIRIMGAANYIRPKSPGEKVKDWWNRKLFHRDFAPHIKDLEGETIKLEKHGFIVIYERGEKPAGEKFAKLFREEKEELIAKIKTAKTNDEPRLNEAKFIQDLSALAMDLEIITGMNYFTIEDDEGNKTVYRHTFKEGVANPRIAPYLAAEKQWHQSQAVRIHNNKTISHHVWSFLKSFGKWFAFAMIVSLTLGVGGPFVISPIIAGFLAVTVFVGLSFFAIYKASKDNQSTIEFGTPEFEMIKSELPILEKMKADSVMAWEYLRGKSSKIEQSLTKVIESVQKDSSVSNEPDSNPLPVIPAAEFEKPRPVAKQSTMGCFSFFRRNLNLAAEADAYAKAVQSEDFTPRLSSPG